MSKRLQSVTGQGWNKDKTLGSAEVGLEQEVFGGVLRLGVSETRGNDCILDRRSKIQDVV